MADFKFPSIGQYKLPDEFGDGDLNTYALDDLNDQYPEVNPELSAMPQVPGRFAIPAEDFSEPMERSPASETTLAPGEMNIPYQDRPDYKASQKAKQSSVISSLMRSLNPLPGAQAQTPQISALTSLMTKPKPSMDYEAELQAALDDRKNNMENSVRRAAADDISNYMLMGMGIDQRVKSSANEERKRMEDLELKGLDSKLALAGKVQGSQKAKMDLENMGSLNDVNSPISASYRNGAKELLGNTVPDEVLNKLSASQIQNLLGQDLGAILNNIENRKMKDRQFAESREDRNLAREDRKMLMEDRIESRKEKELAKQEAKSSKGFEALDKDYAKEYNEWTSVGRPNLEKNFQLLDQSKNVLEKRVGDVIGTSGRVTGRLPDWARSEESVRLRDDVHAAAVAALKATLGAQFTEKEGERIKAMSYNEKLSPEENLKKIALAQDYIKNIAQNNNAKAEHFENNRTLGGYRSNTRDLQGLGNQQVQKSSPAPGSIVKVKGKSYRVGSDGDSLEEVK